VSAVRSFTIDTTYDALVGRYYGEVSIGIVRVLFDPTGYETAREAETEVERLLGRKLQGLLDPPE
jgi:hypothetical protein